MLCERKWGEQQMWIDYKDRRPIYEQLKEQFVELIRSGVMKPGDQLPSVRNLAVELAINPNTIQRVYTELEQKGCIYCVKGKGNYVADNAAIQEEGLRELEKELAKLVKKAKQLGMTKEQATEQLRRCWEGVEG